MAFSIYGMLVAFVFILGATTEISEARCNKRFITHVIRKRNCYPRALLSVACLGTCTSYTKPSVDNPGSVERFCECCRESSSRQETVNMICLDEATRGLTNISLSVMIPTSCMCRPCSVLPDTIVPAEQHIFQHTAIKRSKSAQNVKNVGFRINSKHLKDQQEKNRHDNLV